MMNDAPTLSALPSNRLPDQSATTLPASTQQISNVAKRIERRAQLSCNARAPRHSSETTAKVLRLASKGKPKDKSIKRIADELGLSRDQVAGIIGRERRRRKAWREGQQ
jgi:hypothetical protein